jgi:hypothetical protein
VLDSKCDLLGSRPRFEFERGGIAALREFMKRASQRAGDLPTLRLIPFDRNTR